MSLHGFALFCLVYVIATATPGPGIAAIVARALSRGTRGLPAFIAGFVVGDLLWFTLAATGMAFLAQTMHTAFVVLKYVGAGYLLYLAYRTWTAPAPALDEDQLPSKEETSVRLFAGSLALTLGNPKVMVFFLALLPTVIDITELRLSAYLEIVAASCVILSGVLWSYSLAAVRARRLFKDARAVQWLNRGSGGVITVAAVFIASQ